MGIRRIIVCEAQVPFVRGGAEYLVRTLVTQLQRHGFAAELVSIPFKWYPKGEILAHAAAWRLIDLSESNGQPIDLVIASKFPTYFVRHPNKVTWLVHQHRAAYELCGTEFSDFDHVEEDVGTRDTIMRKDNEMLARVPPRLHDLAHHLGSAGEVQWPPARSAASSSAIRRSPHQEAPTATTSSSSGGWSRSSALTWSCGPCSTSIVRYDWSWSGEGTQRQRTEQLAESLGLSDRITFAGAIDESVLVDLYKDALAIVFAPFDEDYGYVTLESFLAHKPVITTTDAGGPLEFVEHETNGLVCQPTDEALAAAVNRLAADKAPGGAPRRRRIRSRAPRHLGRRRSRNWSAHEEAHHPDPVPERGRHAAGDAARPSARDRRHRHDRGARHRRRVDGSYGGSGACGRRAAHRLAPPQARACHRVHDRHRRGTEARRRLHRQHRRRQPVRRRGYPDAGGAARQRRGRHRHRRSERGDAASICRGRASACSISAAGSSGRCRIRGCRTRRAAFARTRAKRRCG